VASVAEAFVPDGAWAPLADDAVERVAPDALAGRVGAAIAAGARHVMLVGLDERSIGGTGLAVEVALTGVTGAAGATGVAGAAGPVRLRVDLPLDRPSYPSLARSVPAAHWDEREIRGLLGINPVGHPDARRLVLHEHWPGGYHPLRKDVPPDERPPITARQFVPFEVHGEGVYQLPVGPIHAGIIEPGHFRFSAVGERILHLDAYLFFTHRGLEKLVEGRSFVAALPVVERACGVCTVTHALTFSQAVEALTATRIPERAAWARVVLAEMERLYNHVGDLGNICAGIGFHSGASRLGALKEQLLRLNEELAGHRYLMGTVGIGGLRADLDPAGLDRVREALPVLDRELAAAVRAVIRSDGVRNRTHGTGVVTRATAESLGALGVAARASGLEYDLRRDEPYARYTALGVEPVLAAAGDVAARFDVRAREAHASVRLVLDALAGMPDGSFRADPERIPAAGLSTIAGAEGPRGASRLWLRAGPDGTVDRLHLRSASFANWPVVAAAVPGDLVPDFPLINKSFELCYACTDR
jgi:Ni,Fe-hydrogenase III large subunit/Ni,Fe-hydrogenase III component G